MFIKGDDNLNFSAIADVIDIGHDSGVDHIGLITPKIEAGQYGKFRVDESREVLSDPGPRLEHSQGWCNWQAALYERC